MPLKEDIPRPQSCLLFLKMAETPTSSISWDTSSILLAVVSVHYTPHIAMAIEQTLETYRIVEVSHLLTINTSFLQDQLIVLTET